jgi:hypothetical protein
MLVASILGTARSQQPNPKFTERIKLEVHADANVQTELTSYLKRELRGLHDVELVENNPQLIVRAFEKTMMSADNRPAVLIVFVTMARPINPDAVRTAFGQELGHEKMDGLIRWTKDAEVPVGQLLRTAAGKDVEAIAKAIVAGVDTGCIEQDRKDLQEVQDMIKKDAQK